MNINVNHIGIFLKIIKIYFLASKYVWRSVLMFFLGGIGRDGWVDWVGWVGWVGEAGEAGQRMVGVGEVGGEARPEEISVGEMS